jgi:two-component system, NtrC family, response regulator PilR
MNNTINTVNPNNTTNTTNNTNNSISHSSNANNPHTSPMTVLVVDDEPDLCQLYSTSLSRAGYRVRVADGVQSAQTALTQYHDIDCVVSDFRMPDGTGLDLVKYVTSHYLGLPICLITAYSNAEQSVEALKEGAFDYLSKPVSVLDLRRVVASMVAQSQASHHQVPLSLTDQMAQHVPGQSTAMKAIHHTLAQLAQTSACVVIQGEPGTGKELAARALHACSVRAKEAFVVLDCSVLKDSHTAERALFGEPSLNNGAFHTAQSGTLLLEEVSSLPLDTQVLLLNTLQEKSIHRQFTLGKTFDWVAEPIDVRVLISSTKPLAQGLASGKLRQDLFYRLNVMALTMPPLRDRSGDAPWLAKRWLAKHASDKAMDISAGAMAWLRSHAFSGNIRELDNVIERGIALCITQGGTCIEVAHLQANDAAPKHHESHADSAGNDRWQTPMTFPMDLMAHLASIERKIIEQALQQARYNRTQAAVLLGLNVRQIRYRIEQLGIEC